MTGGEGRQWSRTRRDAGTPSPAMVWTSAPRPGSSRAGPTIQTVTASLHEPTGHQNRAKGPGVEWV
jgi:hypothetical protein